MSAYSYVRSTTDRVFARIGNEYVATDGVRWKQRIAHDCTEKTGAYVSSQTIDRVMLSLAGRDLGDRVRVPVRYAEHEGATYVDLADKEGRVVEISRSGVRVLSQSPVAFYRPASSQPLPIPIVPNDDGEAKAVLADYRNLLVITDETSWHACLAWQLQAMRQATSYSCLQIRAPKGTGKTTRAKLIRRAVDPSRPEVTRLPDNVDDLSILCENAHALVFDNLRRLPREMSDALCRVATGDGGHKRALYSDRDLATFEAANPFVLTSIGEAASEPDLQDRSLVVKFERPAIRKTDAKIDAEFSEVHAKVFGALCYLVSVCISRDVPIPTEVRMQGPCKFAAGLEGRILPEGAVVKAYTEAREESEAMQREDAFLSALLQWLHIRGEWTGSMTELLSGIEDEVRGEADHLGRRAARPKWLPETPRGVRSKLDTFSDALVADGVTVAHGWAGSGAQRRANVTLQVRDRFAADDVETRSRQPARENLSDVAGGSLRSGRSGSNPSLFPPSHVSPVDLARPPSFLSDKEKEVINPINPISPIPTSESSAGEVIGLPLVHTRRPDQPDRKPVPPPPPIGHLIDIDAFRVRYEAEGAERQRKAAERIAAAVDPLMWVPDE